MEGVAYYNIFSSQTKINEYSTRLLQKSIDKLNLVKPYLRYLSSKEYAYLSDTVYYYKALSFQKLFKISNDRRFIEFALKSWEDYFNKQINLQVAIFKKLLFIINK